MGEFDVRFELDVVVQAARDPAFRKRAARVLNGFEFGDPQHQWLWHVVGLLGPDDVLTSRVARPEIKRLREDDQDDYLAFLKRSLSMTVDAPSITLKRLSAYVDSERIRGAMVQALDVLNEPSLSGEEVVEARSLLRAGLRTNDTGAYGFVDVYEGFIERQEQRLASRLDPTRRLRIPTKFMPSLDADLLGGILPRELGILCGVTGRGKSQVAMAIAVASGKQMFETVFVGTEMDEEQNALRADANILGDVGQSALSRFEFDEHEIDDIQEKFERFSSLKKRLRIASTPVMRCNIAIVEEILDHAEDDWGEKVKLLVMDSGDHIRPVDRFQDRRNKESQAYWELKSLAQERNIAIWSTSHAPKEVVEKIATAENVGESYDKSRIADHFVSFNANERQRRTGEMVARNGKNRRGARGSAFILETMFDNVTFKEKPREPDMDEDEDDDPEEGEE